MKYTAVLFTAFLCSLSVCGITLAATPEKPTSLGQDFWVCFQKNYREFDKYKPNKSDSLALQLVLSAEKNTTVTIETAQGKMQTYHLTGGKPMWVYMDTSLQVQRSEIIQPRAIHITADNPITVHGINQRFQTTDTFTAFPVECLGTEYRAVGHGKLSNELLSQCAVVATENSTRVTITPSVKTRELKPANKPFVVSLNKGDVYQVLPNPELAALGGCDLTGTLIQADKNIAVFSGHNCAYIPVVTATCNHLVEQLLPLSSWGRTYYVGMLARRSAATIRIIAHEPDTRISINGEEITTLNKGEYYTSDEQREHLWITADKAIGVAQYSQGFNNGDSVGDPMMMMIRPVETFQRAYHFVPPVRGNWQHFVNIVVSENGLESLQLDGSSVDTSLFKQCGVEGYVIGQVSVAGEIAHTLTCDEPFGINCYGYNKNDFDAYGNM